MDERKNALMNMSSQFDIAVRETEADGLRISYDDCGKGEPALLFMPGWCGSRAAFSTLVARCSEHRRTLALDWRGHGQSEKPQGDFGAEDLLRDALAVINASGAASVIPVALSHAGWIAIDLRRRLGSRISALIFVDWIVLSAPPPFLDVLNGLQSEELWAETRNRLFSMWLAGVNNTEVTRYIYEDMGSYGFGMWQRAAREIGRAYALMNSPLDALTSLDPPPDVLHLYSRPHDRANAAAQHAFSVEHAWFHEHELNTCGHIVTLEAPDEIAAAIDRFISRDSQQLE